MLLLSCIPCELPTSRGRAQTQSTRHLEASPLRRSAGDLERSAVMGLHSEQPFFAPESDLGHVRRGFYL